MKRLYWMNPEVYEAEVEVTCVGENRVTTDPVLFHPDEGGQPADRGTVGGVDVVDVQVVEGQVVLTLGGPLADGRHLACVDKGRRLYSARQHTAQHIISGVAAAQFGLETVGVHIGLEACTVDFDRKIDWETAADVERRSMSVVMQNVPVKTVFGDEDVRSRFDLSDVDSDVIRVVRIGEYDASACCGAHVARTGDIGIIRIVGLEAKKEGTRVSFVAGDKALEFSEAETEVLRELRRECKCSTAELPVILRKSMERAKELSKEVDRLEGMTLPGLVESAVVVEVGSSKVGIQIDVVSGRNAGKLAAMIAEEIDGAGIVISDGDVAISSKSLDAGELMQRLREAVGGKGGGSATSARGRLDGTVTIEQIVNILQGQ